MRALSSAFLLATALLVASACGGPPPMTPSTVSLRMRGAPADATVTIDDKPLGPLSFVQALGVALPPGTHRITVTAPGHFPFDKEVTAKEGDAPIALEVRLVPIPD